MSIAIRNMFLLYLFSASSAALATTLVQLSFDEVVASSELVFEGRVVSVEARETGPRSIHSFVTFEIMEIIKGDLIASTLELRYLGGRVGNRQMEVIDINVPVLGETGIYFVESMREMQIHPLVGWSQGHFLIRQDDSGIRRIHSAGDRPIQTVTSESAVVTRARRYAPAAPLILDHDGVARGVEIQAVTDNSIPMSASAFKVLVRDVSQRQTAAGIGR